MDRYTDHDSGDRKRRRRHHNYAQTSAKLMTENEILALAEVDSKGDISLPEVGQLAQTYKAPQLAHA